MKMNKLTRNIILIELSVPIILLLVGMYHGLMQTIYRSGTLQASSYAKLDYYQGLTLHGVINAIVLTTFFAVAFGKICIHYYLKKEGNNKITILSFSLMLIGTLMAALTIFAGKASVLYTFYPPLKAYFTFYLGAALLIVGSWLPFFNWIFLYLQWRKENKNEKTPLAVFGTLINFTMWFLCTLSVAYEVLVLLIPWSLGWVETINVSLSRTLFWFFGHPLVYFWLMPTYIMFYVFLPKLAGGKLYSDLMARIVFILFLLFSIPVGLHHQFAEPGLSKSLKFIHMCLTYAVGIPSLITAFTVAASLEYAAVKKGAKGIISWIFKLPYLRTKTYMFDYLICGLILFIFGGLTGIVNASFSMNRVVHNTSFISGHFHMTVGGPVYLAIIGMTLYLYAQLTNKKVYAPKLATITPYLWVLGIAFFSSGLMWGGLHGEPRRTNLGLTFLNPDSPAFRPDWVMSTLMTMLGGIIMSFSFVTYAVSFFGTLLISKKACCGTCKIEGTECTKTDTFELPTSEVYLKEKRVPLIDSFKPWVIIAIILIIFSYTPVLYNLMKNYSQKGAPAYQIDNPVPETNK